MMEERNEIEKMNDDTMLPGFRFHPTDEELVHFYLRRKIQQKCLPIELIKQVDIYKYDPWDLPKLACTGEKEWYFYCPRDRKYRNSPRPNRVTRAGFWKATGTDRPIYSSSLGKCIGLKKSLVFYRGRASKGIKTDWMMHEFRLPSPLPDLSPTKKPFDNSNSNSNKTLSPQDSWAICRIFKKTNSMSMAQKALSHAWMAHQFPAESIMVSDSDMHAHTANPNNNNHLSSENLSCTTEIGSASGNRQELYERVSSVNFSGSDHVGIDKVSQVPVVLNGDVVADTFMFSTFESSGPCAYIGFEGPNNNMFNGVSVVSTPHHEDVQALNMAASTVAEAIGFPFSLPLVSNDAWKPTLLWEPCPSDVSNNRFST